MNLFKKLIKKPWFWVVLVQNVLGVYCLVGAVVWYIDYYPPRKWDNLSPLPNGEKAKEITEIYVHREIHVVTELDNHYACRDLDAIQCWFPIPREVNHYRSHLPWVFGRQYPQPPPGTRQLVVFPFDRHEDAWGPTYAAIILADGQVAVWSSNGHGATPLYVMNNCWGLYFLFLLISVLLLIKSLHNQQKKTHPPQP